MPDAPAASATSASTWSFPRVEIRIVGPGFASQQAERFRMQPVTGQNRHPFPVHHVQRRPPSPQFVIVHCREIVVNEGIRVDHLDRAPRPAGRVPWLRPGRYPALTRLHPPTRAQASDASRLPPAAML
jgi:hypothetical protein